MSNRIVVGLDGSPSSEQAFRLALRRIKNFHGVMVGFAVVDQPSIEHIAAGAQPGAFELTDRSVSVVVEQAKKRAQNLIAAFRTRCEEEGVEFEDVIYSGAPHEGLQEEAKTSDIIVVGMHTYFYHSEIEDSFHTLGQLLKHPVCPVIAVPETMEQLPENIIIAYDGSAGAARAMKAFVHITPNLPTEYHVSLLCVSHEFIEIKYHLEKAAHYLRSHNIDPSIIVRDGTPSQVILELAKELHPAIVTLGSPLYKGLGERLFGSTTESIIKAATTPIFVYH